MTERLYDVNSHMRDFTAKVLSCAGMNGKYELVLDKTAFFPGGGGQAPDSGKIGGARITDVFERGGDVVHIADAAVPEGQEVSCGIDWETRFRRMQNHSGEHIVSGIVHRLFGYDNVGFHMGDHTVTLDFSGELSPDDVQRIETLANLAVYQNLPVTTAFHTPDELSSLSYRSKLEFTGAVRLVTIPGVDCCACCAPHVEYTGEIGIIKILDAQRHRGGMRLTEATAALCSKLGVKATILPMTDSVVTTYVRTRRGEMHFQEYWVKHRGEVAIEGVSRRFREPPVATAEVIRAIEASDAVVVGPSNPVTSISPILECAGVREALRNKRVIAVSPFIGDAPVSGPAAALMRAFGKEASSAGTCGLYEDFVDLFIQDTRDPVGLPGALRLDTLMVNRGKSLDLARNILTLIYGC